jgi:hypothetical protein
MVGAEGFEPVSVTGVPPTPVTLQFLIAKLVYPHHFQRVTNRRVTHRAI